MRPTWQGTLGLHKSIGHAESTGRVSATSVPDEFYGGMKAMRLLAAIFVIALLLDNGVYLFRAKIRGRIFILLPAILWSQRLSRRLMIGICDNRSYLSTLNVRYSL